MISILTLHCLCSSCFHFWSQMKPRICNLCHERDRSPLSYGLFIIHIIVPFNIVSSFKSIVFFIMGIWIFYCLLLCEQLLTNFLFIYFLVILNFNLKLSSSFPFQLCVHILKLYMQQQKHKFYYTFAVIWWLIGSIKNVRKNMHNLYCRMTFSSLHFQL